MGKFGARSEKKVSGIFVRVSDHPWCHSSFISPSSEASDFNAREFGTGPAVDFRLFLLLRRRIGIGREEAAGKYCRFRLLHYQAEHYPTALELVYKLPILLLLEAARREDTSENRLSLT
jgi:hypothetical protein